MGVKRCKAAFVMYEGGRPRVFNPGALLDESDPVVKEHPGSFEDVETYVSDRAKPPVEQATADPGEKRSVRRPARRETGKAAGGDDKAGEGS